MASKTVKVGSSVGLHARPASIIADAAGEFDEDIFLNLVGDDDEDETDAASSLMIMARSLKEAALLGGTFLCGLGALELALRFSGY